MPPGTVGGFDRCEQLAALDDEQRGLRAVVLSHDNDPIAVVGPDLLMQRRLARHRTARPRCTREHALAAADHLLPDRHGRHERSGVEPGEFGSFGHDYRADMARFVRDTYGFHHH